MIKQAIALVIGLAVLLLAGCATDPARYADPWTEVPVQPHGRYVVFAPLKITDQPVKLCFVLHGWGGDSQSYGRLWHEALRGGYLVVAPQAPPKNRGGTLISTWQVQTDRAYLRTIWRKIHDDWRIDPKHTVIAGYSSGAAVACDTARLNHDQVRGLVLHGAGPVGSLSKLKGISVYLLVGERDPGFSPRRANKKLTQMKDLGIDVQLQIAGGADHASLYSRVRPAADWIRRGFTAQVDSTP